MSFASEKPLKVNNLVKTDELKKSSEIKSLLHKTQYSLSDTLQNNLFEKLNKLQKPGNENKLLNKESMSNMPIKELEGEHFILKAVPDTTINFHLLIKK